MIVDMISDLHGFYPKLEGGDLLIIAGDLTKSDKESQYIEFQDWFEEQNYRKKVIIAGNHDNFLVKYGPHMFLGCDYLCDSGTEFEGLKIWGSPWSLWFKGINPRCKAFTGTEEDLKKKFDLIPDDIDILVTHMPPWGIFDEIILEDGSEYPVGSKSLDNVVFYKMNLQLHIFGHIHEQGGKMTEKFKNCSDRYINVNASYVNERYEPVNKPVRVIL